MTIFDSHDFDARVSRFAGTTLHDQWGARIAKVADKVFTLLDITSEVPRIVVKCSEESFEILTALEGIVQAPYFAKRKWISISKTSPLTPDELETYIERSYALVAANLTRKVRTELCI